MVGKVAPVLHAFRVLVVEEGMVVFAAAQVVYAEVSSVVLVEHGRDVQNVVAVCPFHSIAGICHGYIKGEI